MATKALIRGCSFSIWAKCASISSSGEILRSRTALIISARVRKASELNKIRETVVPVAQRVECFLREFPVPDNRIFEESQRGQRLRMIGGRLDQRALVGLH